ncbi:MAG TPA: molybdopterin cofactor-binding domain-containing protein [Xanthobacteraceae bacterium]|nr:molybdopterin cofactor-binding domain-containing protein [Xanthobacteraceae bacterium]
MTKHFNPSRRDLLKGGGALVVSFSLIGQGEPLMAQEATAQRPLSIAEVDAFLAIDARGRIAVYSGKVDLGTGVRTALAQMAAEELDVPFNRVRIVEGDTALTPDQGKTWGSLTIQAGGVQIRNAAATARAALIEQAAQRLKAKSEELSVADGVISAGNRRVTYGELIGGKMFSIKLDPAKPAKSKEPKDYKIVGKSVPRVDIPAKVTGRFTYINNLRLRGMLHGRVIRPPSVGAKLESVDEGSIKDIAGIVRIVREGNFLGVVAQTEWGAIKAARQLKATWSKWEGLPEQAKLFEHVRGTKVFRDETTGNVGNTTEAMAKEGVKKVSASYDFAIHTHGSQSPSCAVAEFRDGKLTSWSASQATHDLRKQLAEMFAMPVESVRCIYLEGSGCYGRNGHEDAAADAAVLAKAVGRPVRVQWSRADEHGWDPKGPPTLIDLRAALDGSSVTAWESEFFIPQQTDKSFMVPLIPATLAGMPAKPDIAPGNIFQNSNIPYKFANIKAVCHRLETTPFRPSWIRTPGRMQNTYANECFLDELAAVANADPIEFRLKYLDPADQRGIETLNRVAALAKWDKRPSPQQNVSGNVVKGRGVSYVKYELTRTYVAVVAEVEVDRAAGTIKVPKVYMAHDCGQIINPDGLRNQLDGNVIQMVSRTLIEELKFDRSHVTSLDWVSYPVITFPDVPEIVLDLIDRPNERPWGAGEPSAAVVPSAISNAVFDATGVRLRSVPYTPDKVKAAMRSGA